MAKQQRKRKTTTKRASAKTKATKARKGPARVMLSEQEVVAICKKLFARASDRPETWRQALKVFRGKGNKCAMKRFQPIWEKHFGSRGRRKAA